MAAENGEGKCEKLKTGFLASEFSFFLMISSPSLKVITCMVGHENEPYIHQRNCSSGRDFEH